MGDGMKKELLGSAKGGASSAQVFVPNYIRGAADLLKAQRTLDKEKKRVNLLKAEEECLTDLIALFSDDSQVSFRPFYGVSAFQSLQRDLKRDWTGGQKKQCRAFSKLMEDAEKFVLFGEVPNIQELANFADQLSEHGLLKLPYRRTFLEFEIMLNEKALHLGVIMIGEWHKGGVAINRSDWPGWYLAGSDGAISNNEGPDKVLKWLSDIVKAFLVLLMSRSSEITHRNKRGQAVGASDAYSYRTVSIPAVRQSAESGTHASPRLHWRRGHIRRQKYGRGRCAEKLIWVAPVLVGDSGLIEHEYSVSS